MMALPMAIWGAWAPKLFPDMGMPGFSAGQQALVMPVALAMFGALVLAFTFHPPTAASAGSLEDI